MRLSSIDSLRCELMEASNSALSAPKLLVVGPHAGDDFLRLRVYRVLQLLDLRDDFLDLGVALFVAVFELHALHFEIRFAYVQALDERIGSNLRQRVERATALFQLVDLRETALNLDPAGLRFGGLLVQPGQRSRPDALATRRHEQILLLRVFVKRVLRALDVAFRRREAFLQPAINVASRLDLRFEVLLDIGLR